MAVRQPEFSVQELTREVEWRRCQTDFHYFAERYWHIQIPRKGSTLLVLRDFQKAVADAMVAHDRVVALKARQIGFTTVVAAYAFWSVFFHADTPWLFVSRNEDAAKITLARVKYGYQRLSQWVKDRGPKLVTDSTERIAFGNDSRIDSIPASADSGRGDSVYGVLFDEAAHMSEPEELFGSLEPLCYGPMFVFSSANGMGNFFHGLWLEAQQPDSVWASLFFPWNEVPERDEKWYERTKRKYRGQDWLFYQEYPATADEAFAKSGRTIIGQDLQTDSVGPPLARLRWENGEFLPEPLDPEEEYELELHVWEYPTVERDELGRKVRDPNYVLFCDPAEGLEHGDYTGIVVWDANNHRVVARSRTHWPVEDIGEVLAWLGHYYHIALVMVERNNIGLVPITYLVKTARYPRLYRMEQFGQVIKGDRTPRFGWHTNRTSKPKMVHDLLRALRAETIDIPDPQFWIEASTFVADGRGSYNASPKNYDDVLIATAGGYQGVTDIGQYPVIWHDEAPGPTLWSEVLEVTTDNGHKKRTSGSLRIGRHGQPAHIRRTVELRS